MRIAQQPFGPPPGGGGHGPPPGPPGGGGYGPPPGGGGYGPPPGGGGYGPPPGGGGYGPPPGGGGYGPPPGGGGYGPPPGAGGYGPPPGGYTPNVPPGFTPGTVGGGGGGLGGPKTDTLAVVGLVASILGLVGGLLNILSGLFGTCCFLCTLGSTVIGVLVLLPSGAGAIMGGLSASRINKEPERLTGKGLAMAALVVGVLATLLALAEIILPWFGIACFSFLGSGTGTTP